MYSVFKITFTSVQHNYNSDLENKKKYKKGVNLQFQLPIFNVLKESK